MSGREDRLAAWEKRKAAWEARTAEIVGPYRLELSGFAETARMFLDKILEDLEEVVLQRRPPVSLRLLCEGEPAARVIVLPRTVKLAHKELRVEGGFLCELVHEKRRRLWFDCHEPDTWHLRRYYGKTVEDDMRRLVDTARAFVTDPRAVFARSRDRCCICGRRLTDELSRSRGIGPECTKRLDWMALADPGRPRNVEAESETDPQSTLFSERRSVL